MTQLHDLLDDAAESYVPDGLARRAVVDAGRRRRQRFAVAGAVASVAAVALAFVVVVEPFTSTNPELVTPATAAPFPGQLPSAEELLPLAEAPMSAASAAYVVDGEVVLVNAATAQAVTAFASEEDIPPSLSGASASPSQPSITGDWTSVALSPNGQMLLMTNPRYMGTEGLRGQLLYLLDIGAGTTVRLQNLVVADDEGVAGWSQPQLLAWSPASDEFACVCGSELFGTPQLQTYRVSDIEPDGHLDPVSTIDIAPSQVIWGAGGIAVQLEAPAGAWHWVLAGGLSEEAPIASADLLVLNEVDPAEFGMVRNFFSSRESDTSPVASGPAWTIDIDTKTADSMPDRPAFRGGTAVAASAVRGGYLVVVRPRDAEPGEPPPPTVLDVAFVDAAGNQTSLTQLPLGTSSSTFASSLVSPS